MHKYIFYCSDVTAPIIDGKFLLIFVHRGFLKVVISIPVFRQNVCFTYGKVCLSYPQKSGVAVIVPSGSIYNTHMPDEALSVLLF